MEMVNHPNHYNAGKYEVIDVIDDWNLNFELGNAVKYIARCEHKNNKLEDLNKAIWYIQREIDRCKKETPGEGSLTFRNPNAIDIVASVPYGVSLKKTNKILDNAKNKIYLAPPRDTIIKQISKNRFIFMKIGDILKAFDHKDSTNLKNDIDSLKKAISDDAQYSSVYDHILNIEAAIDSYNLKSELLIMAESFYKTYIKGRDPIIGVNCADDGKPYSIEYAIDDLSVLDNAIKKGYVDTTVNELKRISCKLYNAPYEVKERICIDLSYILDLFKIKGFKDIPEEADLIINDLSQYIKNNVPKDWESPDQNTDKTFTMFKTLLSYIEPNFNIKEKTND